MKENELYFSVKSGDKDNDISPDNVPLRLLAELSNTLNSFIHGSHKPNADVNISIRKGSLALVALPSPTIQEAIIDLQHVRETDSLDNIDPIRARIFKDLKNMAKKENLIYTISDSQSGKNDTSSLIITKDTEFKDTNKEQWVLVELYVHGKVVDIGGKTKTNIHLTLDNGNTIMIDANSQQIADDKVNRLYKDQLVRILAEQNVNTHAYRNEKFIEFVNYEPKYDEKKYEEISAKVEHSWADVPDISEWIEERRGNHAQEIQ